MGPKLAGASHLRRKRHSCQAMPASIATSLTASRSSPRPPMRVRRSAMVAMRPCHARAGGLELERAQGTSVSSRSQRASSAAARSAPGSAPVRAVNAPPGRPMGRHGAPTGGDSGAGRGQQGPKAPQLAHRWARMPPGRGAWAVNRPIWGAHRGRISPVRPIAAPNGPALAHIRPLLRLWNGQGLGSPPRWGRVSGRMCPPGEAQQRNPV